MRLIFSKGIYLLMLSGLQCIQLNAQSVLDKLELGIQAGTFIYQGDLTPSRFGSYKTPGWQLGISASSRLSHFFSIRSNIAFGKLSGDDAKYAHPEWRQHRNFNFKSPVFELSGLLVWDVLGDPAERRGFSPYVFAGAGFSVLGVRRDASNLDAEYFSTEANLFTGLDADMARRPPSIIPVLPVGAGVRYELTEKVSLHLETSYRVTFTDYLDGFSKAANPSLKDYYQSYSFGIFYRFNKNNSLKCPR